MKRESIIRRLWMPLPDLEAYYRMQRLEQFQNNEPVHGIGWRRKIHNLIHFFLVVNRIFSRQKLIVIGDKRTRTNDPVIYACTHVGRYDIEMALQLIGGHSYFFMGDPGEVYKNMDGLILWLNGTVFTDTRYKEDRHIGKENCVKVLEQGGNLLIYPEGAWNITENQVVMQLFTGTAEMSIRTGAEIVPIAIEQYGKTYYANVGKNISPDDYVIEQKDILTERLRDTLCTLKWEIWEQFPVEYRRDLPPYAARQYLNEIMSQSENGYTVEEINRTRYHSKDEIEQKEVQDYWLSHRGRFHL